MHITAPHLTTLHHLHTKQPFSKKYFQISYHVSLFCFCYSFLFFPTHQRNATLCGGMRADITNPYHSVLYVFTFSTGNVATPECWQALLMNLSLTFSACFAAFRWWFSRRKVGNKLRSARIKLNYNMVTGRDFSWKLMRDFVYKTVLFAILDSFNRYMKNRVALENKFEIRRLVMEKILYAEVAELDKIKSADLEHKVASDITSTLNFINKYLPSLVSGLYAFLVEGSSLFMKRKSIDGLAFAYPIAITVFVRFLSWAQYKYYTRPQKKTSRANQDKLDMAMANALDGIIDIQTNNLQVSQLHAFDNISQEEIRNKEGLANFLIKTYSTLNKMSAFSYVVEIWCVHKIMKRQNLDHKQYSKIQQEIDHVVTIGRRTFNLLRRTKHIFQYQSKVVKLLDMTNFIDEHLQLQPFHIDTFVELRLSKVVFSYKKKSKKKSASAEGEDTKGEDANKTNSTDTGDGVAVTPTNGSANTLVQPTPKRGHNRAASEPWLPPSPLTSFFSSPSSSPASSSPAPSLSSSGSIASLLQHQGSQGAAKIPALDLRNTDDMVFKAGKRYAIIGQNTAGKSTLTKLITKLYCPDEGEISINGVPYHDIPRVQLRDVISYIPQRPLIVAGTIQDNILIGNPEATEEEVMFAAEASGLFEFLGISNPTANASNLHLRSRSYGSLTALHQAALMGGNPAGPMGGHDSEVGVPHHTQHSLAHSTSSIQSLHLGGMVGHAITTSSATGSSAVSTAAKKNKRKKKQEKTEKKKKKKQKKKAKKRRKPMDSDSDEADVMARTLSFAELGEMIQPHSDFYSSSFSASKHLSSFVDRDSSDGSEDDGVGDTDSDIDSDDDYDSDDIDEEEADIHRDNDDDEDDEDEDKGDGLDDIVGLEDSGSRTGSGATIAPTPRHAVPTINININGIDANNNNFDVASPFAADEAALAKAERMWLKKKRQILNQTVEAGSFEICTFAVVDNCMTNGDFNNVTPAPLAGADVSGGFAQSIALARVFVRTKAKIIILGMTVAIVIIFK
jgi:ABC-type multidrug transport system fused ATPase/permease subunit